MTKLQELAFTRGYWLVEGPKLDWDTASRWIDSFDRNAHTRETSRLVHELSKWQYIAFPVSISASQQIPNAETLSEFANRPRVNVPYISAEQFVQFVLDCGYRTNSEKRLIRWLEQQPRVLFRLPDGLGAEAAREHEEQIAEQVNALLSRFSIQGKAASLKVHVVYQYRLDVTKINSFRLYVEKPSILGVRLPGLNLKAEGAVNSPDPTSLSFNFHLHSGNSVLVQNPKIDTLSVAVFDAKDRLVLYVIAEPIIELAPQN